MKPSKISNKIDKFDYKITRKLRLRLALYRLGDFSDKISKLNENNKKIFLDSYFKLSAQREYGMIFIILYIMTMALTITLVFEKISSFTYYFLTFTTVFLLIILILSLNISFQKDLEELLKILENKRKR